MFSELVHAAVALTQLRVLFVVPNIVNPPPSAVVFVGVATLARNMFLSAMFMIVSFSVVDIPLTVRLPVTVISTV